MTFSLSTAITSTSTRRFFARPSSVLLSAIGLRIARIKHQVDGRAEVSDAATPPSARATAFVYRGAATGS